MGRRYVVGFQDVLVSNQQDLVTLYPNTGSFPQTFAKLLRVWVMCTDISLPTAQQLMLGVNRRLSISTGGGGDSPTPAPDDAGDPTSQYLAHTNDTAMSISAVDWDYPFACYLYTGADLVFSDAPECNGAAGFVFGLRKTPSTPVRLSGGILYEEFGSGV